jgi:uncharacterized membrane protein
VVLSAISVFANVVLACLVVGTMFGVWLTFNPKGLAADAYAAQQRQAIRALNVLMPRLGAGLVALTVLSTVLARHDSARFAGFAVAALCFLAAGVITRLANQPLNAQVLTWPPGSPPEGWTQVRDAWWRWHVRRMVCGLAGLSLLIGAVCDWRPCSG